MSSPGLVYQLKITLKKIQPEIWRRIQVPGDYNFADLHLAIQVAMGWYNIQSHEFKARNPRTNMIEYITNKELEKKWKTKNASITKIDETDAKISDYFICANKIIYEYDLRDSWVHYVCLQKIVPAKIGIKYPILLAGKRACPIEECGGVRGYRKILKILKKPKRKEYKNCLRMLRMQGYFNFNPDVFKFNKNTLFVGILDQKEILEFFDFLL